MRIHLNPRIIADPDILAGRPIIEGTQVLVSELVAAISAGQSPEEVARARGVTLEDVRAALAYAAQRAGEPVAMPGAQTTPPTTAAGQDDLGLDPAAMSPLGRQLIELRRHVIASGVPLISSWDELEREIAEIRGERAQDAQA